MRPLILLVAIVLLSLTGCSGTPLNTAVADGQLFCAKAATPQGQAVAGLASVVFTAAGVPAKVTNAASTDVAATCAILGMVPVQPVSNPTPAVLPASAPPLVPVAKTSAIRSPLLRQVGLTQRDVDDKADIEILKDLVQRHRCIFGAISTSPDDDDGMPAVICPVQRPANAIKAHET